MWFRQWPVNCNDEGDRADHPRRERGGGRSSGLSSVASKFGYRPLCAVVVDECLAGGGGSDQRGDGGIIECARQTQAGLVQSGNCVVRDQRVVATGQRQVVLQVLG